MSTKRERTTHDEWKVFVMYDKKWNEECSCLSLKDAQMIKREYLKASNVVRVKIEKARIKNKKDEVWL